MGEPPQQQAERLGGVRKSTGAAFIFWLFLALLVTTVISVRAERTPNYGRIEGQ